MCCLSGYVECGRKFVQIGVDLNERDHSGKTPTHNAAYKGSYECLDLLVSNGAAFKCVDDLQRLPLHYAAAYGHYQCAFTLVGIGSPVNVPDANGCHPLHLAAAYDHEGKVVEYLLEHKADATAEESRGFSPLHYAIAGGNVNGVTLLISHYQKNLENSVVKKIVNKRSMDVTPLQLAAKLGSMEILHALTPYYEDVNLSNSRGVTPLILAAREGHAQSVHFLLRFGAKVAMTDEHRMTAVHYSAKNGHSQCLMLLLHNSEDEAVVNMLDGQSRTALMLAASGNHLECIQILLKCGADPNILDKDSHSCLFRAVVNGQNSIVQLLLSNNANVQRSDVNGKTVLHLAAACGHLTCMQMIMSCMTDEEIRAEDNQFCTALHWACYNGHANCVEYLIEKDIFKELHGNVFSPVHCAAFSGVERCLEAVCDRFGNDRCVRLLDALHRTPLHVAAVRGHSSCARMLVARGADTEAADAEGRTPLIAAAQAGHATVVALHWACLKKHTQTALLILGDTQGDSVVSIINNEKKMPLHIAVRNGLVEVTRALLQKNASLTAVDNEGLTPALCCAPNQNVAQCLALILQSLPQLTVSGDNKQDNLNLLPFYKSIKEKLKLSESRSVGLQVSYQARPKTVTIPKPTSKLMIAENNDDCFLVESKDFNAEWNNETEEKKGMHLHKAYSDMSLVCDRPARNAPQPKPKFCRECYKLQHACFECNLKKVLKKHITGRSTDEEFQGFIVKCIVDDHPTFKRALAAVNKEISQKNKLHNSRIPYRLVRSQQMSYRMNGSDVKSQSTSLRSTNCANLTDCKAKQMRTHQNVRKWNR
nr:unnamed protein product [Callosobruchus analis]